MSTKSYAQDVVYEHKMSTKWCTQMLFMSTDGHMLAQYDAQNEYKMSFMSTRCHLWAQKA